MTTWRPARLPASEREPYRVGELLDGVTRSMGAPRAQLLSAVFANWEDLVGSEVAAHARPRSLRDGVLVVAADQPAWAAQLRFLTGNLLARIQTVAHGAEIGEIRITVGEPDTGRRPRKGQPRAER